MHETPRYIPLAGDDLRIHLETWASPGRSFTKDDPPRFVYFAERDGRIKIGHTCCVSKRASELRAKPLLAFICTWYGAPFLERKLHAHFANARTDGEWFNPTAELVDFMLTQSAGEL